MWDQHRWTSWILRKVKFTRSQADLKPKTKVKWKTLTQSTRQPPRLRSSSSVRKWRTWTCFSTTRWQVWSSCMRWGNWPESQSLWTCRLTRSSRLSLSSRTRWPRVIVRPKTWMKSSTRSKSFLNSNQILCFKLISKFFRILRTKPSTLRMTSKSWTTWTRSNTWSTKASTKKSKTWSMT